MVYTPLWKIKYAVTSPFLRLMIHMRLRLCLSLLAGGPPDFPHGFGQAHIVGLELIVPPSNDEHGKHVSVLKGLTPAGHAPFRKVVGYYVLEAGVSVDDQQGNEGSVQERAERASGERSNGQRQHSYGDNSVKSPVVAAVLRVWLRSFVDIVHSALDLLRQRRKNGSSAGSLEAGGLRDNGRSLGEMLEAEGGEDGAGGGLPERRTQSE